MTMKRFSDSEACQDLSKPLSIAEKEEIEIRRKDGIVFSLVLKPESPFNVAGIKTKATARDILDAVRDSRKS